MSSWASGSAADRKPQVGRSMALCAHDMMVFYDNIGMQAVKVMLHTQESATERIES